MQRFVAALTVAVAGCALAAAPAVATEGGPQWTIVSTAAPTYFAEGSTADRYVVTATNTGGAATTGLVNIRDVLPHGIVATEITARKAFRNSSTAPVTCTVATVECETSEVIPVGDQITVTVTVEARGPFASAPVNEATVSGGGATAVTTGAHSTPPTEATTISAKAVPFGVSALRSAVSTTQAGGHPNFTTEFVLNRSSEAAFQPAGLVKDIALTLPQGLLGDPSAVPRCNMYGVSNGTCPPDTVVGTADLRFGTSSEEAENSQFVYNIAPYRGEPAAFALGLAKFAVRMDTSVQPNGEYAVHVALADVSEQQALLAATVTLWGVPGTINGPGPYAFYSTKGLTFGEVSFGGPTEGGAGAFLSNPTSCEGQLTSSLRSDSWAEPGSFGAPVESYLPSSTGCDVLTFAPALKVASRTHKAGAASGYGIGLEVPQDDSAAALATPAVRDIAVTLPVGTTLSPSAANGLAACNEVQFGIHSNLPGECPGASTIGSVKIVSPLLADPVEGSVYVGTPECEPCTPQQTQEGRMVPLLLEAELPGKPQSPDVMIKLKGETSVNQQTGRLTTTFANDPQLPFSNLELSLKGGEDAPLVNPSTCGPAVASAELTPWSSPTAIEVMAPAIPIEGCSAPGFAPSLQAGMTGSAQGGSFSPFSVTLERPDGQQSLGGVVVNMPPGISGLLSKVPLCGEAQANAGTCPASSQIGTTTAVVGPGSEPYTIEGGKVYLTEKYGGGSFGLSIVTPAHAGPFTLAGLTGTGAPGDGTVVIRAAIDINPSTAAITVKTGPLPTQLNGIPLDIDRVIVNVNRPEFMFNPTDCNPMSVAGTITSSTGTAANVSSPFQATDCASLPFKPKFSALIHAHHSRKGGEYLHVVVKSAFGQANIHQVHVQLPGKLPSRLETLKLACTEAQFAANPAGCPAGSFVGHAIAHTPILPVAMQGPAIFVSHGGKGFPNLDLVLQGDGVHITLVGNTYINKKQVTTSTFKSVPDVPVSRFDLVLPAGPHSALAGNGNMCAKPLYMPVAITGQNGAVVKHRTKVMVHGCRPELVVAKHRVHHEKATIVLHVPSAGRLIANGRGLRRTVKRISKHGGRVGITIQLGRHDRHVLAKHPHERINATVKLRFKPKHGKTLHAKVKVLIG